MSDKTVAQKLLIKVNYKILLSSPPANYRTLMGELPAGVSVSTSPPGPFDLIQAFVSSGEELRAQLEGLKSSLKPGGLLWITYPKGTSKIKADINRDSINEYAHSIGLQGVAMISIDETWSALRLKVI
jgi:hypothetical protein